MTTTNPETFIQEQEPHDHQKVSPVAYLFTQLTTEADQEETNGLAHHLELPTSQTA